MISGSLRSVNEIFALPGCYQRSWWFVANVLGGPTACSLNLGPIGFYETSVTYYKVTLRKIPKERRPYS